MLRDLASVLEELHLGVQAATDDAGLGVRIVQAEMTLPVDAALVLKDGGCALLIDVARNPANASWLQAPSRLALSWGNVPTEELP